MSLDKLKAFDQLSIVPYRSGHLPPLVTAWPGSRDHSKSLFKFSDYFMQAGSWEKEICLL